MNIKRKKSDAVKFLEKLTGGPLTFGQLLESIRLGDEISQLRFAEKLGISKSHLCDIEKGRKPVSAFKASEYAKILGYSNEQFVRLALQDEVNRLGLKLKVIIESAS
ncbi:MAG TPA: helix-turn-helix transcriptional regulator [Bdellovibrio sp.]|nr:helix-turn-helix transcriptional regulator [Bdellovibrio sp.]